MAIIPICPLPAEISDISQDCLEHFGLLRKAIFQRKNASAGVLNTIADPTLLASWTPLLIAAGNTKVVQSPYLSGVTEEAGAMRTYDDSGVDINIGREHATVQGNILSVKQKTIKELKTYQYEDFGIWMVNESGLIGCIADDPAAPTTYYPVPVTYRTLFIGDKAFGGVENPDMNGFQFRLAPNWSDNFVIVTPADFNALTDLVTP